MKLMDFVVFDDDPDEDRCASVLHLLAESERSAYDRGHNHCLDLNGGRYLLLELVEHEDVEWRLGRLFDDVLPEQNDGNAVWLEEAIKKGALVYGVRYPDSDYVGFITWTRGVLASSGFEDDRHEGNAIRLNYTVDLHAAYIIPEARGKRFSDLLMYGIQRRVRHDLRVLEGACLDNSAGNLGPFTIEVSVAAEDVSYAGSVLATKIADAVAELQQEEGFRLWNGEVSYEFDGPGLRHAIEIIENDPNTKGLNVAP